MGADQRRDPVAVRELVHVPEAGELGRSRGRGLALARHHLNGAAVEALGREDRELPRAQALRNDRLVPAQREDERRVERARNGGVQPASASANDSGRTGH